MEGFLHLREVPSFFRVSNLDDPSFQFIITETRKTPKPRGFMLNMFEELEAPILAHIRSHCPNLYPIGPLHAHLKSRQLGSSSLLSSNSMEKRQKVHDVAVRVGKQQEVILLGDSAGLGDRKRWEESDFGRPVGE